MKAALILLAIALLLVVALALDAESIRRRVADPAGTFDVRMQIRMAEDYPGGVFVNYGTLYRRCEDDHGERTKQGVWVYYNLAGARTTYRETCWR